MQEANALLPQLNVLMERQERRLRALEDAAEALRVVHGPVLQDLHEHPDDSPEVAACKRDLRESVREFREGWEEVEALGAVVKDVRAGLIDFHGERNGKPVWLCWRYGEPAVAYWHPMEQGFDARKPLEEAAVPRTLN